MKSFYTCLMMLFFKKHLLDLAIEQFFTNSLNFLKPSLSISLLLESCCGLLSSEFTVNVHLFSSFILLFIDKWYSFSFDLVGYSMHIDPLCKQLVPELSRPKLLDHLVADLLDSLLNHVNPPWDDHSNKFSLVQYAQSLPLLLSLETYDFSKALHWVKDLNLLYLS